MGTREKKETEVQVGILLSTADQGWRVPRARQEHRGFEGRLGCLDMILEEATWDTLENPDRLARTELKVPGAPLACPACTASTSRVPRGVADPRATRDQTGHPARTDARGRRAKEVPQGCQAEGATPGTGASRVPPRRRRWSRGGRETGGRRDPGAWSGRREGVVYPVTPASRGPRGTPGERAYPAPLETEAPPVVSTRMSCLEGTGARPGHGGRGEKMALEEDLAREDSRVPVVTLEKMAIADHLVCLALGETKGHPDHEGHQGYHPLTLVIQGLRDPKGHRVSQGELVHKALEETLGLLARTALRVRLEVGLANPGGKGKGEAQDTRVTLDQLDFLA